MKIKNHYIWLCIIWFVSGILNASNAIICFVEDNFALGILFLVVSLACYFVGGVLLQKALYVHNRNKELDTIKEIMAEELRQYYIKQIEPFEDFKNE